MNANQNWIAILRSVPVDMQDTLALGITTGSEIVVQRIVKLEPDFMVIRGRLAGTQDAGRIVVIPYNQLTFVAVQQDLKDAQVEAIFGNAAQPAAAVQAPSPAAAPAPEPVPEITPATTPPPAVNPPRKPDGMSKTILLAKLRDRLKDPTARK